MTLDMFALFGNDDRTILDLCAGTGSWSQPYADDGYTVITVTLPHENARLWPTHPSDEPRYPTELGDVREYIGKVHGILAAPVCTVFSNAGAQTKRTDKELMEGLALVDACLRLIHVLQPEWWALENPVGKLSRWLGEPVLKFHPHDFGDPWTKETWLWGNFTCPEMDYVAPTNGSWVYNLTSKDRESRSKTFPGFAKAFKEANP